jgi:hypothetical protein
MTRSPKLLGRTSQLVLAPGLAPHEVAEVHFVDLTLGPPEYLTVGSLYLIGTICRVSPLLGPECRMPFPSPIPISPCVGAVAEEVTEGSGRP